MGFNEFMTKLFGNKSQRDLKEIDPYVIKIKAVYPEIQKLSNDELRAKTDEIKQRIQDFVSEENARVEELRKGIEDKELEDYGWNSSALEINHREISEFIEESCEGVLLCYDNEIQFSGFVIVDDVKDVKQKVKEYIINKTKENIKSESIDIEDDDVIESLEFFGIKA